MTDDRSNPYDLDRLENREQPLTLRHARLTPSTNDWAKQEAEAGNLSAPALFLADSQSAGRGRGANAWWSPVGNIAATLVVEQNPHLAFGLVPLLAGLAVRRALVRLTGLESLGLKWPNDLVVGPRKAAGLLCERLQRVDLIGIGINVNTGPTDAPAELRERITSLQELTGQVWDLTDAVRKITREVLQVLSTESTTAAGKMLQEYSQYHWPTGKVIELTDTDRAPRVVGRCVGIDPRGRLMVKAGYERLSLLTGSIVSVTTNSGERRYGL